jgi:hypothetical protein
MEPTFTEVSSETVTAELQAQLATATAALPPSHRLNPHENEPSESKETAYTRLQDWAFTKGFALVIESAKTKNGQVVRQYVECVHHKKETRNYRKLNEAERQRLETKTQMNSCKFSIGIYWKKELGCWWIRSKNLEHNHAPNPDLFQYHQHREKTPQYAAALAAAEVYRGILGYKDHAALLRKDSLPEIGRKTFYNLQRKEGKGTLTRQEELEYILQLLEEEDVHVRFRSEYTVDANGERNG